MPLPNPFAITYKGREVGGATAYQLTNPYTFEVTHDTLALGFDVLVVGSSFADFHAACDALEQDFRKRLELDEALTLSIDGTDWVYTEGSTILKTEAEIAKSGDISTDRGLSRSYTVTIRGQLPPADVEANGLRDIVVNVIRDAASRSTVTVQGVYMAAGGNSALTNYANNIDLAVALYLVAVDASATFELVDENFDIDRHVDGDGIPYAHQLVFTRQYVEQFFPQTQDQINDPDIVDHRVTFQESANHPGDSAAGVYRMRRVVASYDCAVRSTSTTDVLGIYEQKVMEHVRQLFLQNYEPQVHCIEDHRVTVDKTSNRLAATVVFLFQDPGGGTLVEVSQSLGYREQRTLDYTPVHEQSEVSFEVDAGWANVERVTTRVAVAIGELAPKTIIVPQASGGGAGAGGAAGGGVVPDTDLLTSLFFGVDGSSDAPGAAAGGGQGPGFSNTIAEEGWNVVGTSSEIEPSWIGDPSGEQIRITTLTETVVERYTEKPGRPSGGPISPSGGLFGGFL